MPLLPTVLACALVLDAGAAASLFLRRARPPRLPFAGRAVAAATGTAVLALGVAALLGAGPGVALAAALLLGAAVAVNAPVARSWTTRGLVAWSTALAGSLAYLAWVAHWIVVTDLGVLARGGATLLWVLEAFVFVLSIGYLWELVDVLARWEWARRLTLRPETERSGAHEAAYRPFVSLHVPTHNEPPDLVIATLESLLALEYDAYEVLVLDNNTDDPALWHPVEDFCRRHERLRFFHLEDWPGFKSGALNFGLEQVDERTDLVGVVDADYQVQPDFLARCAPLFSDAELGFVQTPQDYRDWEGDSYFRRLYYSYSYFFDVSQRSRNERDGAIFGGTMGLIRKDALVGAGGWDEWCITEDAELSLRLLQQGWHGTHIEESFGHGIMPLTFEALKRQRFRWCFGGVQILRMHWRSLLPGRRTAANRMSLGQRWAYLVGGLQWFGDLAGLGFTAFLLLGSLDALVGSGTVVRRLSGLLLVCVVGLVVLGAVRSVALLHRATGARWREALGAFGLWFALGWVVSLASARGLVAREGAFLRTPKARDEVSWRDSLRGNRVEVALATVCAAGAVAGLLAGTAGGAVVAALLLVQALGHGLAPYNSLAAVRADLTPELQRRRREKRLSWTRVAPGVRRWGLSPAVATVLGVGLLCLVAAPVGGPVVGSIPDALGPQRRTPAAEPATDEVRTRPDRPTRTPSATLSTAATVAGQASASARPTAPAPTTATTRRATPAPTVAPTPTQAPTQAPTTATARKPGTGKPTDLPTQAQGRKP